MLKTLKKQLEPRLFKNMDYVPPILRELSDVEIQHLHWSVRAERNRRDDERR